MNDDDILTIRRQLLDALRAKATQLRQFIDVANQQIEAAEFELSSLAPEISTLSAALETRRTDDKPERTPRPPKQGRKSPTAKPNGSVKKAAKQRRAGRPTLNREHYLAVAEVMRQAKAEGKPMRTAVAEAFNKPLSTVNNWLLKVHKLGLLDEPAPVHAPIEWGSGEAGETTNTKPVEVVVSAPAEVAKEQITAATAEMARHTNGAPRPEFVRAARAHWCDTCLDATPRVYAGYARPSTLSDHVVKVHKRLSGLTISEKSPRTPS